MKKLLFLLFIFNIGIFSAEAQIFKKQKERAAERAKNRAENKAQNKVDSKVDDAVDDVFDGIGGLFKKKKKKKKKDKNKDKNTDNQENSEEYDMPSGFDLSSIMGGKKASEMGLQDDYTFDIDIKGKMIAVNKKGKEEVLPFNYLLTNSEQHFGFRMEQAEGIIDWGQSKMVTIIPSQKMATVMDLNAMGDMAETEDSATKQDQIRITKTGKKKKIGAYNCEQYLVEGEDTNGELWFTKDVTEVDFMNFSKSFRQAMKNNAKVKYPKGMEDLEDSGMLIESIFQEKGKKEKSIMRIESIAKEKNTLSLNGYKIMDMGSFMGGKN
jgi:hypothetical protein